MPMIRNQQFPWLYQPIVLMEIDLMRAARQKQTVYGERRPEAVGLVSLNPFLGYCSKISESGQQPQRYDAAAARLLVASMAAATIHANAHSSSVATMACAAPSWPYSEGQKPSTRPSKARAPQQAHKRT